MDLIKWLQCLWNLFLKSYHNHLVKKSYWLNRLLVEKMFVSGKSLDFKQNQAHVGNFVFLSRFKRVFSQIFSVVWKCRIFCGRIVSDSARLKLARAYWSIEKWWLTRLKHAIRANEKSEISSWERQRKILIDTVPKLYSL